MAHLNRVLLLGSVILAGLILVLVATVTSQIHPGDAEALAAIPMKPAENFKSRVAHSVRPNETQIGKDRGKPRRADKQAPGQIMESYGRLPLTFEPNRGQTDREVKFLSRGRGHTLFLTPTEAVLSLNATPIPPASPKPKSSVLRMKLVGSNRSARVEGHDELPGKANYFVGSDPKQWRTNIPTYGRVGYEDVYPGINLVYYGNQGHLEYDFVVAPGGDPSAIKLALEGADKVEFDAHGDLIVRTVAGDVRMRKPLVYQHVDGVRKEIFAAYLLHSGSEIEKRKSRIENGTVGFRIAAYDATRPLVIDPVLVYSTYLGGAGFEIARSIAVDAAGNAYVAGETGSTNFPTASPLQPGFGGGDHDVFVAKLNSSGSALVYSTYLGGNSSDRGRGIAVDAAGNAYVTGDTKSSNFPVAGAFQSAHRGNGDAFVAKLNPSGSSLLYSTYLGGSLQDEASGIAIDAGGGAYITGFTASTDFPTANAVQPVNRGFYDAFVAKLNSSGSALVYSTYLGGGGTDYGFGIAVDTSGNAYATGLTTSPNFPTANAVQPAYGGRTDGFVAKLNTAGSVVYSTYLGGTRMDVAFGVAVDASGNAYVTGTTSSFDFPTRNALQAIHGGDFDAFLTKLNAAGSALLYSTYLGGRWAEQGYGIAVDGSGSPYVGGATASTNFPAADSLHPLNGYVDAFVTKLNSTASALMYSTYLGGGTGGGTEQVLSIAVDGSGDAYAVGRTLSADFPTANPFASSRQGSVDGFVTKIASTAGTDPIIAVTPTFQDFGNVNVGSSADRTFTIQNIGAGIVSGTASTLAPYSIVSGSSYDLIAGASQTVTVRFSPSSSGSFAGSVTFTGGGDASRAVVGTGVNPILSVTPASQAFGNVNVGSSADRTFTVQNTGGGTLTGTASASTPLSIVSGGTYNLAAGASQVVTVRFGPTSSGPFNGNVSFTGGGGTTRPVTGVGVGTINVTPASQDFGNVNVGSAADRTLTVQNMGTTPLTGAASTTAPFSIMSGGAYSLAPGASQTVTVRFSPTSTGNFNGNVSFTGGGGASRPVSGVGVATINVTPVAQNFGNVNVGSTADRTFTVQNTGGGTLTGTAAASAPFSIVSGGTYTLAAGASQVVTVRFSPTSPGPVNGDVSFTGGGGTTRPVTGVGVGTINVTPASQDFGNVNVGSSADRTFTVQNTGTTPLTGAASTAVPFSIVSGGAYSLAPGASQTVTVRFSPTSTGNFNGNVSFTGGGGAARPVSGVGAATINVTPASQSFGNVNVGSFADRTFTVQNGGTTTLTGSATVSAPFSIVSGGNYSLATGASQIVTVRFSPTSLGNFPGSVNFTGGGGASRSVTGIGVAALSVTPASQNFGNVNAGSTADGTFTVQNIGGGTLAGGATTSAPFSIVSGSPYNLAPGVSQTVAVRFGPTSGGNFNGNVSFTGGGGAIRPVSGVGLVPGPTLSASPTSVPISGTITATWSGIVTPAPTDWIGLYVPGTPDAAHIDWIYVSCAQTPGSARAAGSCPFVVPASTAAGPHELRLFANNDFIRLATSNTFTVTSGASVSLSASPTSIPINGTITATWSGMATPTPTDWIGFYTPGAPDAAAIDWIYVSCAQTPGSARAAGSCPFVVPASTAAGPHELRLFANNDFIRLATSNTFTVTSGASVSLSASPTSIPINGTITATWSGMATPTSTDWIGLYTPGAPDAAAIDWIYVSCFQTPDSARAAGSCPFVVPTWATAGPHEVRLFANNDFTRLATSNAFTVTP